jgi:hypothetical protein
VPGRIRGRTGPAPRLWRHVERPVASTTEDRKGVASRPSLTGQTWSIDLYTDDAVLVVKPGTDVIGKLEIRRAIEAIAVHFNRTLDVRQGGMLILETGDTALVLAKATTSANNSPEVKRKAIYVFRRTL